MCEYDAFLFGVMHMVKSYRLNLYKGRQGPYSAVLGGHRPLCSSTLVCLSGTIFLRQWNLMSQLMFRHTFSKLGCAHKKWVCFCSMYMHFYKLNAINLHCVHTPLKVNFGNGTKFYLLTKPRYNVFTQDNLFIWTTWSPYCFHKLLSFSRKKWSAAMPRLAPSFFVFLLNNLAKHYRQPKI